MDIEILRKAGLTESQAKAYIALIENGPLSPGELARETGESRTNSYALTDKLVSLNLAQKLDTKKAAYKPTHPSNIALLAERRRKAVVRNEQAVQNNLDSLIQFFYQHSEAPGARTLEGIEAIKHVYEDTLATKQDIYLLRTTADIPSLGEGFLDTYRQKRAALAITTHALTPQSPEGRKNMSDDEKFLFHRTWLPKNSYSAPVEIDVYGNKVALIAFGGTQMATIIDSPLIAEAMRQILALLITTLHQDN